MIRDTASGEVTGSRSPVRRGISGRASTWPAQVRRARHDGVEASGRGIHLDLHAVLGERRPELCCWMKQARPVALMR